MPFGEILGTGAEEGKIVSRLLSYIHADHYIVNCNLRAGTTLANVAGEISGQQCVGVIQIFNEILKKSANYHSLLGRSLAQKYLVRQWSDYGVRYVVGNRFQSPIVLKDIEMALSKTYFIAGDFVTLCDLIIFYGLYPHVSMMEEGEKEKYNNTCHWFSFLQKDPDLIQNMKKVTFEKNVSEAPGESYFSKRKCYSGVSH